MPTLDWPPGSARKGNVSFHIPAFDPLDRIKGVSLAMPSLTSGSPEAGFFPPFLIPELQAHPLFKNKHLSPPKKGGRPRKREKQSTLEGVSETHLSRYQNPGAEPETPGGELESSSRKLELTNTCLRYTIL